MSNDNQVFKMKQEWLERVMASNLNPAAKVFAFGVFKRMFGLKLDSNPTEKQITQDTGLSRSKFNDYRMSLQGALTMVKAAGERGGRERYTYTLNLDWDGNVPTRDIQCTHRGHSMSPQGTSNVPTGDANTTINTTINTESKITTPAAPVEVQETVREINSSDTGMITAFDSSSLGPLQEQSNPITLETVDPPLDKYEREVFRQLTRHMGVGPKMTEADALASILRERTEEQW